MTDVKIKAEPKELYARDEVKEKATRSLSNGTDDLWVTKPVETREESRSGSGEPEKANETKLTNVLGLNAQSSAGGRKARLPIQARRRIQHTGGGKKLPKEMVGKTN